MNQENINSLSSLLESSGFDGGITKRIVQQVCFRPAVFTLCERFVKDSGWLTCTICFEREQDFYTCRYYDASFLKNIEVPDLVIQSIDVSELDRRMESIEWSLEDLTNLQDENGWQPALQIETVMTELLKLSASNDGKYYADYLKLKYWSGIELVAQRNNVNALRSKYEVSQRFYFFDGKGISTEEAYRFLLNRWLEKKINSSSRKRNEQPTAGFVGANEKKQQQRKRRTKIK